MIEGIVASEWLNGICCSVSKLVVRDVCEQRVMVSWI